MGLRKSGSSSYRVSRIGRKQVGTPGVGSRVLNRLKASLRQMVDSISEGKQTPAYMTVAEQLSVLAGLKNGHVWGWRYVASVCSGSTLPSQKFIRAFSLLQQKFSKKEKRWFYFAHRHYVACVYDKCVRAEIIRMHMVEMNYKEVTYTKYMQVKRKRK